MFDFFPLINSLRISLVSTIIVFFIGIFMAHLVINSNKLIKGLLDVLFTLPLVLPPTVVGFLLIRVLGPNRIIGSFFIKYFNIKLTMNWWSAIFSTSIVIFPLMYRTARGAFEAYDNTLSFAGKTLGLSNIYIFWNIKLMSCKKGIIAGVILSFARALGEYGATNMICGYTPYKTATISTTVYQLWRTDNDILCLKWVLINIFISIIVLCFINFFESNNKV